MEVHPARIGIVGTFDVENYGDLLFPLLAELELTERLGPIDLRRFSYRSKTTSEWPYAVDSITDLPEVIHELDGLLIGGGFLLRFDKDVAPGYAPPLADIHHPTGYWLSPALLALQHDVPVAWNAPGMHEDVPPAWARSLVAAAVGASSYVSVRDERSRSMLADLARAEVHVVPDTAFGIGRLVEGVGPDHLLDLQRAAGLTGPYIVVQASLSSQPFMRWAERHAPRFHGLQVLALPIGPELGDRVELLGAGPPAPASLSWWPDPLSIAALIGGAEAVVGHSYHLAISALACGVPVFTPQDLTVGKYAALADLQPVHRSPGDSGPAPTEDPTEDAIEDGGAVDAFFRRLGRGEPSTAAKRRLEAVAAHWDRVAEVFDAGPRGTRAVLNRFWQALPGVLEDASIRHDTELAQLAQVMADSERRLVEAEARGAAQTEAMEALSASQADQREHAAMLAAELERSREVATGERAAATAAAEEAARIAAEAADLRRQLEDLGQRLLRSEAAAEGQVATVTYLEGQQRSLRERVDSLQAVVELARRQLADRDDELVAVRTSTSWRVTAPLRRVSAALRRERRPAPPLLELHRLRAQELQTAPFRWATVDGLFRPKDAAELARTFPDDGFTRIEGYGGEKDYQYDARELVAMGATSPSHPATLTARWRQLGEELASTAHRDALSLLTGCDLTDALVEINALRYGPGACLGPHADLPDKLVTHILYFNEAWEAADGGCLAILGSRAADDVAATVTPLVGTSAVLVRSDDSWHTVLPVQHGGATRRSVTVTFHRPGSASSMWPAAAATPLGAPAAQLPIASDQSVGS